MKMNLHLNFNGNAGEAFAFYKQVFGADTMFAMRYSEAPPGAPVPEDWGDKIMHTAIPVGANTLMGCDSPQAVSRPMGGFQISLDSKDESEVRRVYAALAEGGSVQMPLAPTFWSPLFGMCTDKFGVAWMVGITGETPATA